MIYRRLCIYLLAIMFFTFPLSVFAENIDPNNDGSRYAWGENIGWINFKPIFGPGVTVTGVEVTGFAWGENIGWINMNPSSAGVFIDGDGNLSGYAWGENIGWINFAPANGGVFIDACGDFNGYAWGENIGWISFRSDGENPFYLRTSWVSSVDTVPPVTHPTSPIQGWRSTSQAITLTATDCGTGVMEVRHSIDGGSYTSTSGSTASVLVTNEGCHSLSYYSVDNATPANVEAPNQASFCVDETPPAITISVPLDGAVYYLNTSVTPSYLITDGGSGVASSSVTPMSTSATGSYAFTITATDAVGNTSSMTHSYSVVADTVPPVINIISPANNATYYVNSVVLADYNVTDSGTGVASVTADAAIGTPVNTSAPGSYSFAVTAIDLAGNTTLVTNVYTVVYSGNMDPANNGSQYAWGENIGWINLQPSWGPGVTVSNTAVTGYAWGENIGWVNFSPSHGGVVNNGAGILSGYAWGENIGWINFAPTGGGVTINPATGVFSGYAWGENIGWINFGPTGKAGITSWRPPNHPPVLDPIGNQAINEGQILTIVVTGTDPDGGDILSYSASNLPPGATFDQATRTFTWTPASGQVGTYPDIHFEVTDGEYIDSENIIITVYKMADLNRDGTVNSIDFNLFKNAYITKSPAADLNGDGSVNSIDFNLFKNAYIAR